MECGVRCYLMWWLADLERWMRLFITRVVRESLNLFARYGC